MAGLFGSSRRGGPIGLFGRAGGVTEEEQRRLADLSLLASQLGGSLQSHDLQGVSPREPYAGNLVPTAQLPMPHRDVFPGGGDLPFEPPSSGSPFPPGFAGDPRALGLPGAAGGGPARPPISGLRAEAEGYADQMAQRGTREWGSAVRDFVMQGPHSSGDVGFGRDKGPTGSGFLGAAEEDGPGFGLEPGLFQSKGFGRENEAESVRPAAPSWEGEASPTQFMRPVAFQESFERAQDRAIAQEQARRTGRNAGEIYGTLRGLPGAEPEQRVSPAPVGATRPRAEAAPQQEAPQPYRLGWLSEKYESAGGGAGEVSTGRGDPGSVSYGVHQISSDAGTLKKFITANQKSGKPWAEELARLKPKSKEFENKWKEIAARDPKGFRDAQYSYLKETHYDRAVKEVVKATRLNLDGRDNAVREAVWSTAMQHGGAPGVLKRAVLKADRRAKRGSAGYDAALIREIYAERKRYILEVVVPQKTDPREKQFLRNSANRYRDEEPDALRLLERR